MRSPAPKLSAALPLILTFTALAACGADTANGATASNCELLSNEEATDLAGYELVAGDDSPFGCPFVQPGELTYEMTVGAASLDGGSLKERAEKGYPQAADIVPIASSENEAFAVLTPTGATVAAVVTARDGWFVEIGVFMLGIEPNETDRIRAVADYAHTALDRALE